MKYPEQESSNLEFKLTLPKNEQIIKTVIGFCNQNGGKLIIGVADDGTIIGINQNEIQKTLEYLEKSIYEASSPAIIPLVYVQNLDEKLLLIVEVSSGMNKPYFLKSEGLEKGVYIRLGRTTIRATSDIIEELKRESKEKPYDMMPVSEAKIEDLDNKKIDNFLKSRKRFENVEAFHDLLLSYNIIVREHAKEMPTVAGLLNFGKNPQQFFHQAYIICTHFAGTSGRNIIATIDCMGTLMEQFSGAFNFVASRLYKSSEFKGPIRHDELEIPSEALREIIINAIVHRNYRIGAPSKIAIYDDRVEIYNPGTFAGPLNINNLCAGITYIRNAAIAKILRHAGLIETLGTGFLILFESYAQRGLPKPEVIEGENYIKCILPRKPLRPINEFNNSKKAEYAKLLNLLSNASEISISEIVNFLKINRSTAARRIKDLVDQGLVKVTGIGKGTRYSKT